MKTSLEKLSDFCIALENQNQKSEKKNLDLIENIKIHKIHEEGGQPLWKTVKHTVL